MAHGAVWTKVGVWTLRGGLRGASKLWQAHLQAVGNGPPILDVPARECAAGGGTCFSPGIKGTSGSSYPHPHPVTRAACGTHHTALFSALNTTAIANADRTNTPRLARSAFCHCVDVMPRKERMAAARGAALLQMV